MFSADWLALREPADFAARSAVLTRSLVDALDPGRELRAVDLAAGTGANVRYVADHIKGREQDWLLVDHDQLLLAHVPQRMSAWAVAHGGELEAGCVRLPHAGGRLSFEARAADLRALDDPAIFAGRTLVTASALLDLVSEPWVRSLADRCREVGAAALFALTYDGRLRWAPPEPGDASIQNLINQHQRGDKGFGPAMGPGAAEVTERSFIRIGYDVRRERSDWILGAGTHDLQRQLIQGWAHAASELEPGKAESIDAWRVRRLAHIDRDRSQITVGHEDLAALPRR